MGLQHSRWLRTGKFKFVILSDKNLEFYFDASVDHNRTFKPTFGG